MCGCRTVHIWKASVLDVTDRLRTLLHAAWLYYEDGLTQAEIAQQMSVSRATVGRFLGDARKSGLVTFHFHSDRLQSLSLSEDFKQGLGLRAAVVIPDVAGSVDQKARNERVAHGAAQWLIGQIQQGAVLALGWGDTVSRTLRALQHVSPNIVDLVTMTGGANVYLEAILGGRDEERSGVMKFRASVVPAPLIASSDELASALMREHDIARILGESEEAALTIVGVGTPTPGSTLVELGYASDEDLAAAVKQGAVGDLLGQFFDDDGQVLDLAIHDRRIGIDIASLRNRENVVAVAAGPLKVQAITAAIRGGYVDVVVTDESTAKAVLELHESTARSA